MKAKCRPEALWTALSGWVLHKKAVRREHLVEMAAHIQWPLIGVDFRSRQVILKCSKVSSENVKKKRGVISQVVKSSLYQHLDVDWAAEMLLLFGGDHRDSRQVGFKTRVFQHSLFGT